MSSARPRGILTVLSLVTLALALPARLRAQVGSTTDILIGQITAPDGRPLEGARVDATSTETQIVRSSLTNSDGRYVIVFPDGGGQYTLEVHYLGMAPRTVPVLKQADEDRIYTNVQLSVAPTKLAAVEVRGQRRPNPNRAEAGGTERTITPDQAARLPIDASDLNVLATLAPGVVGLEGNDTTAAGFSVAGQRPSQNQMTLDGISFGASSLPSEAVRSTRVITNTYDVARGQFTGGQVASTTRGGTNVAQGTFTYALRDPSLEFTPDAAGGFEQIYTQNQLSGGFGGPLIHNKLFTFGAVQLRRRTDPLQSLLDAGPGTLDRLGIDPDSAGRFLQLLGAKGIPASAAGLPDERLTDNVSVVERTDLLLTDQHTLMLRGDWRWQGQDASRLSALSVPNSGGNLRSAGGGVMVALTSHFESGYINELRAYGSTTSRNSQPYVRLPQGRVRITSSLADSTVGISTLGFGGNAGLPQLSGTDYVESSDELSWLSGTGTHRFKLGALVNASRFAQDGTSNGLGTFTYNTLEDFEADDPASFTRSLVSRDRRGSAVTGALYLGDSWRRSQALSLVYGVRLEGSRYGGAPAYNPLVDTLFQRRTDLFPSEVHASPRVGFTYIVSGGQGNPPAAVVRGGFGEFRGQAPTSLFSAAQSANGLGDTEAQLTCIGDAVPTPNWAAYAGSPSTIPTACAGSSPPVFSAQRRSITVFDPDFGAPRSWRGSLGVQRRVHELFNLSLDATYARGTELYGVTDLNLDTLPRFALAAEGGRPVYVPANAIVPSTGALSVVGSRLHPELAQVLALGSGLGSVTRQLTASMNGFTRGGATFQTSYTYSRSRDQSSFNCCSALQGFSSPTTAGNPNQAAYATSDLERRHSFLATVSYPVRPTLEVTAIGRLSSGAPFTPMVSGDINGDGSRNDRAFLFDPSAAADTAVANGMARLLRSASPSVRECLERQLGRVAGRNSCSAGWFPSLDFQLNYRPTFWGFDRRLTISLIAVNSLVGLDELLHGSDLRGWGQRTRPDETLLFVRGFDPQSQRFLYQVNERFGSSASSRQAFRAPFQLALQGRYTIGPDRTRDRLQAIFGGRGGGRGGRGGGGAGALIGAAGSADSTAMSARLERLMPNPIAIILSMRDSLHLTEDQVVHLGQISDTLRIRTDSLGAEIREEIAAAGTRPDPAALLAKLRPKLQLGRQNLQRALDGARGVLTDAQWAEVPESAKNPLARPGQRPGGRRP